MMNNSCVALTYESFTAPHSNVTAQSVYREDTNAKTTAEEFHLTLPVFGKSPRVSNQIKNNTIYSTSNQQNEDSHHRSPRHRRARGRQGITSAAKSSILCLIDLSYVQKPGTQQCK
jgi:hypothetical protein